MPSHIYIYYILYVIYFAEKHPSPEGRAGSFFLEQVSPRYECMVASAALTLLKIFPLPASSALLRLIVKHTNEHTLAHGCAAAEGFLNSFIPASAGEGCCQDSKSHLTRCLLSEHSGNCQNHEAAHVDLPCPSGT